MKRLPLWSRTTLSVRWLKDQRLIWIHNSTFQTRSSSSAAHVSRTLERPLECYRRNLRLELTTNNCRLSAATYCWQNVCGDLLLTHCLLMAADFCNGFAATKEDTNNGRALLELLTATAGRC